MATLDFNIGARVHCKDGNCGKLLKVVVDPYSERITDLIVEKGFLLTTDRVLPLEMVEDTRDGQVYLTISGKELEQYPRYREVEYEEPAPGVAEGVYDRGDVRCRQNEYVVACTEPVIPMVRKQMHQGIGGDLAVVERGTPVKNAQGTAGRVDHLLVDAASGEVSHLVIRRGLIPYYPIVPASEVRSVTDEAVTIRMSDQELDACTRYRRRSAEDIQAELLDRLAKQGFDLERIEVEAQDNLVQLAGHVSDVVEKRHVEAIARAVPGVVSVDNLLETDVVIQTRVVRALLEDPRTELAVIRVRCAKGHVTLQGKVDHIQVKAAAQDIAAEQAGVRSVNNELVVESDEDTEWLAARAYAVGVWFGGEHDSPE